MEVRLNRYLAMCGVAARRKADSLILAGRVTVNGRTVREVGVTVRPGRDVVAVGGRVVRPAPPRVYALNKPPLCLTTLGRDERGRSTVVELTADIPARVFPVGRLDYDVEGLLILTNDGELAQRLMHPRYGVEKQYVARLEGAVDTETVRRMRRGTELPDGPARPDALRVVAREDEETVVTVVFHEGRNRLVKRFFASFGHPVRRLKRVRVGNVRLGRLGRGRWRELTAEEAAGLRRLVGLGDRPSAEERR